MYTQNFIKFKCTVFKLYKKVKTVICAWEILSQKMYCNIIATLHIKMTYILAYSYVKLSEFFNGGT